MAVQSAALKVVADNDIFFETSIPGLIPVDCYSSDEAILAAVDVAGDFVATTKPMDREWDWRECEKQEYLMWVYRYAYIHPEDISDDKNMATRLAEMVQRQILEGSFCGRHVRVKRPSSQEHRALK